ncbi:putative ATP-dependent RNA helicase DHX34 [Armadillidium nasatum]|uniref:Putative ATP-dependent RNA helicase DHX34 n=1 Tax=Armadillidium nasatum TaxID=96803 RepID=A0A5N5T551_9CRUS|nr:putative ATP-dependent RNA helicase DHX34 [Armadillidium nasatum]
MGKDREKYKHHKHHSYNHQGKHHHNKEKESYSLKRKNDSYGDSVVKQKRAKINYIEVDNLSVDPNEAKCSKTKENIEKKHFLCEPSTKASYKCGSANSKEDSEEEIMFDFKDYMWQLDKLFFSDNDLIKKNSQEYKDFWKFLQKYQSLSRAKKIREMSSNDISKSDERQILSSTFELPLKFEKRYCINFALKNKEIEGLQKKLPPIDLEDTQTKRLSSKRLSEFKFILLLYLDFNQKQKYDKLKTIREAQNNLPIAEYKSQILDTIKNNSVTIIAGDTGCGKSTQLPQYLLASGYINIACTQPRRIACISLCKRVSFETLNEYGTSVGFQIRFEKTKTEHTKIVFLTEGLLLRQVAADPLLQQYNVIILDEIHERHLQTDFLLGVIKCLNVQRPDIKIILMYFMGKAPVIQIPGRLYPIDLKYFPISIVEKSSQSDKINPAPYIRILQLVDSSYPSNERGDLLIFLSGMKEITTVMEAAKIYAQQTNKWVILSLHSSLSISEQEKVFDLPPEGMRKCILSTNIAETSVTIDGVRFVVDSGKVKEMSFDPIHKMQKLKECNISQASAEQRKGRAGRTGPGVCFRLYSEEEYSSFAPYTNPEIKRVPLDSLILQMIAMGLPNIKLFPFIEPPPMECLDFSLKELKSHSAITTEETLTPIGQLLSQLPLDISLGKMLIMGSLFHQLGPVLSLTAAMSVQSPFTNRAYRDPDCVQLNKEFISSHGDPFTLLLVYREWLYVKTKGSEDSKRWARKRGFEEQRFYEITKLRQQFSQMLHESGIRSLVDDGDSKKHLTSSERAKRYGELYQLKQMKRTLHKLGPRKCQVLKVDHEGGVAEGNDDDRDVSLELKDLDFKIRYDDTKLHELYKESKLESFKDVLLLKVILCSGLYPNLAIADEHNNYKPGSEQLFHTVSKPFVVLHPNSVFSSDPEILQINQSDILNSSDFTERHPCSNKHHLLSFVSLLETNKPYLIQMLICPFMVFDNFIELKFADRIGAQNLLFEAVNLRIKWKELLELRVRASTPSIENQDKLSSISRKLERELSEGLLKLYLNEQFYSCKRLLAADVKLLFYGPGIRDVWGTNPFADDDDVPCEENVTKGGVYLTPFVTYNCLIDVKTNVTTITSYDSICPFCDAEIHLDTLERLNHMKKCSKNCKSSKDEKETDDNSSVINKKYYCDVCDKTFFISVRDVLKHKKSHASN